MIKTRSFPSGDAPRSLRSGRQPNRGRYHYYVILRSGATKNLTLPSICHPEGLFYRPIAPPQGKNLVFDSDSPESILFKESGRAEDFRFFKVQSAKILVARYKNVNVLRDG